MPHARAHSGAGASLCLHLNPALGACVLMTLAACTGDTATDDSGAASDSATAQEFTEEQTFAHDSVDETGTCDYGWYWPALDTATPLFVVRYDAPEPPYELRTLAASVFSDGVGFQGLDCVASKELRVFAYVDTAESPEAYALDGGMWPTMPALAEVTVSGVGDGAVDVETLTGDLSEPVLVEDEGYLYVGYEFADGGTVNITCPAGCTNSEVMGAEPGGIGWAYQPEDNDWGADVGWSEMSETPDLRVTIGH